MSSRGARGPTGPTGSLRKESKGINWRAMDLAWRHYTKDHPQYSLDLAHYQWYMKQQWGVKHTSRSVTIVDERKYALLLIKWSGL